MSNIRVESQYVKDMSFEVPNAPKIYLEDLGKPDINLSVDINAEKISDKSYEVILKISSDAKIDDKVIFVCEVSYAGIFSIENVDKESLEQVLLVYCPNILFPYIRRVISCITLDSGFPPLMLEPIDFVGLYEKRKNQIVN